MAAALTDMEISNIAYGQGIPYAVLYGLIGVESGNDTDHLARFERRIADELGIDRTTVDRWLATSVGPAQILGKNLRVLGYRGPIAPLAEPEEAVLATQYGACWLRVAHTQVITGGIRLAETSDPWEIAVNRYNVGDDRWQRQHMERYRRWHDRAEEPGTLIPAGALIAGLVGASIYVR